MAQLGCIDRDTEWIEAHESKEFEHLGSCENEDFMAGLNTAVAH
jgi:hypothetical protein